MFQPNHDIIQIHQNTWIMLKYVWCYLCMQYIYVWGNTNTAFEYICDANTRVEVTVTVTVTVMPEKWTINPNPLQDFTHKPLHVEHIESIPAWTQQVVLVSQVWRFPNSSTENPLSCNPSKKHWHHLHSSCPHMEPTTPRTHCHCHCHTEASCHSYPSAAYPPG